MFFGSVLPVLPDMWLICSLLLIGALVFVLWYRQDVLPAQRLRRALDMTPDGVYLCDADGRVAYMNAPQAEIAGLPSRKHAVGLHYTEIFGDHAADQVRAEIATALSSLNEWSGIVAGEQTRAANRYRVSLRRLSDGWMVGYSAPLMVPHDVTEPVKAVEFASRRSHEIDVLASGIAHDFNNMLAPIMGYSSMLAEALPSGSEEQQFASTIYSSTQRATEFVAQIVAFSDNDNQRMRGQDSLQRECDLVTAMPRIVGDIQEGRGCEEHGADNPAMPGVIYTLLASKGEVLRAALSFEQVSLLCQLLVREGCGCLGTSYGTIRIALEAMQADPLVSYFPVRLNNGPFYGLRVHETPDQEGKAFLYGALSQPYWFNKPYALIQITCHGDGLSSALVEAAFGSNGAHMSDGETADNCQQQAAFAEVAGILMDMNGLLRIDTRPGFGTSFGLLLPLCLDC